jgi:hypothetical protein
LSSNGCPWHIVQSWKKTFIDVLKILVFILEFLWKKCIIPVAVDTANLFNYFSPITGFKEVTKSQYFSHEKESIN